MFQFFVDESNIVLQDSAADESALGQAFIDGDDVNHIRNVLRMKPGEKIRVSTRDGRNYFCTIAKIDSDEVVADILEVDEIGTELPCKIFLFQGLPKGDKMELIIQKAVELGVYEVIPVAMKNCVMKLDEKKAKNKRTRWQAIAESAAKQSKRSIIPEVREVMTYAQAVEYAKSMDIRLVPYENEEGMTGTAKALSALEPGKTIAVFIGPEGGFDHKEIDAVRDEMELISLGRRILRTETAGLTALSILMYHMELNIDESILR